MIYVLIFGFLWWSSQHPDNRETGYSNVLHYHCHESYDDESDGDDASDDGEGDNDDDSSSRREEERHWKLILFQLGLLILLVCRDQGWLVDN